MAYLYHYKNAIQALKVNNDVIILIDYYIRYIIYIIYIEHSVLVK